MTTTFTCFGIAVRPDHPEAQECAHKCQKILSDNHIPSITLGPEYQGEEIDCVISFGGDGTLLHTAQSLAPYNIPICGINFGRVGFLCSASGSHMQEVVDSLLKGSFRLEHRSMLRAKIHSQDEQVWQVDAINEILIGGSTRTLKLHLQLDDYVIGNVIGDGLIVATRTGSTAYARSAGGPVLLQEATVIVPSNEITSNLIAPTVVPKNCIVQITNLSRASMPYVIADGQREVQITRDAVVTVSESPHSFLLLSPSLSHPYARLTKKWIEPRS